MKQTYHFMSTQHKSNWVLNLDIGGPAVALNLTALVFPESSQCCIKSLHHCRRDIFDGSLKYKKQDLKKSELTASEEDLSIEDLLMEDLLLEGLLLEDLLLKSFY